MKKDARMALRVTTEEREAMRSIAEKEGTTISKILGKLIADYVKEKQGA